MTTEEDRRKREIFESMSPRRQQRILKKGYDAWNPFLEPKEPPFFSEASRAQARQRAELLGRFLRARQAAGSGDVDSGAYRQGARDLLAGLAKDDDRFRGMYDFALWYARNREDGEET